MTMALEGVYVYFRLVNLVEKVLDLFDSWNNFMFVAISNYIKTPFEFVAFVYVLLTLILRICS